MVGRLSAEIEKAGYSVEPAAKDEKTIQRAFTRFTGILQEGGLAGRAGRKLSINIKIDANPPAGRIEERTIVNLHMPVLLRHYDKASLLATKIAAFLTRPYTKGRDVYDLIWLRSKWNDLEPNLILLLSGYASTGTDALCGQRACPWDDGVPAARDGATSATVGRAGPSLRPAP